MVKLNHDYLYKVFSWFLFLKKRTYCFGSGFVNAEMAGVTQQRLCQGYFLDLARSRVSPAVCVSFGKGKRYLQKCMCVSSIIKMQRVANKSCLKNHSL